MDTIFDRLAFFRYGKKSLMVESSSHPIFLCSAKAVRADGSGPEIHMLMHEPNLIAAQVRMASEMVEFSMLTDVEYITIKIYTDPDICLLASHAPRKWPYRLSVFDFNHYYAQIVDARARANTCAPG